MKLKVSPADEGSTLLSFLRKHCLHAPSVKAIKRAIDSRQCKINGEQVLIATRKMKEGDLVEIHIPVQKEKKLIVLYEDDDLLIVDKPAGVACEPKNFPALLVHRLDKETSGVLVLAKTVKAQKAMEELFACKEVEKTYLAIVDKEMKKKEGTIKLRLKQKGQKVYAVQNGQEAQTVWRCLAAKKNCSLILCKPQTGRTHQIRVHLKEIGHPILGDLRYGKTFQCRFLPARHLLHALRIAFTHPFTGKKIAVEAEVPLDMLEALEAAQMSHAVELADEEK